MTNCKFFNDHNVVSITEKDDKFIFNLNEKHQFDKIVVTSDPSNLKDKIFQIIDTIFKSY